MKLIQQDKDRNAGIESRLYVNKWASGTVCHRSVPVCWRRKGRSGGGGGGVGGYLHKINSNPTTGPHFQ